MTHLAGALTFAMIVFGILTSCNPPESTPEGQGTIIIQRD
jgi:hypothetical protein